MTRDWRDFLDDMLEHAEKAQTFVGSMTWTEFQTDDKTRFATIRAIEVIGEAARRIPEEIRTSFPAIPWSRIIGMRNVLAHDYAGTNPRVVYDTVRLFLPGLAAQLEIMIAGLD